MEVGMLIAMGLRSCVQLDQRANPLTLGVNPSEAQVAPAQAEPELHKPLLHFLHSPYKVIWKRAAAG